MCWKKTIRDSTSWYYSLGEELKFVGQCYQSYIEIESQWGNRPIVIYVYARRESAIIFRLRQRARRNGGYFKRGNIKLEGYYGFIKANGLKLRPAQQPAIFFH